MNYMKRNVFTKKDGPTATKKPDKPSITKSLFKNDYHENYQDMMSNFLSLSPSDKESIVSSSNVPVQQNNSSAKEKLNLKQKISHQKSESSRHNTVSLDENISCIMAISEGRGYARCEIGIAAVNINSPNLILCQLSDNFWYSGTLTKLNILNAVEILVPNTYITAHGESKLIKYIQTMYPKVKITPIPRRHFNETLGIDLIRKLCAPSHQNITLQITEKFYTLSSAAALLNYLEFIKLIKFVPSTLKMEYQAKYGTMLIDIETSQRLELLHSLCNEKTPKSCLFGILNYCVTAMGKRNLRAKILQPLCDIPLIKSSHNCLRELLEKGETLLNLNGILKQFSRVDKLLNLAVCVPQENNVKAAEIMINQALLLKSCLENIPRLYEILTETESPPFQNIRKCLEDPRYNYLLEKINSILSNTASGHGSSQYFQRLYAVKPNINELLDASRKMYSDKVDAISEIIKELGVAHKLTLKMMHTLSRGFHVQVYVMKNQATPIFPESFEILSRNCYYAFITTVEITTINYEIKEIIDMIQITSNAVVSKLLMDIRQEIDAIYHLTGFITELDIIQSLTTASKIGNYCEPTISESNKIKNAIHPFLEHNIDKTDCVPNNIIATPEYNFYLITGPNMGGKSIYIKMIAILQVMFQIGCFIPATSAEFRICDKLFSRIGLSDNIENGSSSFIVEMREMEYIIKNITPNSLVIIDELCRSTNPEEGKILAWRICEKLIVMNGVSNDGEYYKDGSNDVKDNSTNNETIHNLLNITSPFVFVTTHFLELTKLTEQYYSVINLHLSAEQKIINQEVHLQYLHKVESGVTPISRYGLALARNVRFPSDILPRAEQILNEITSNSTTSNLDFDNITFNTTRDSVKITQIQKGLYDLSYNIVNVLRGDVTKANQLIQINTLLARFVGMQNNEFITLIQNQTFDDILNVTIANTTGRIGNKLSNIDDSAADKNTTNVKNADLSYHSLKRRIATFETKEQKKLCTVNVSNEFKKPEEFSILNQTTPKRNSEVYKTQLVVTKPCIEYRKSENEFIRPTSHNVLENKSCLNKFETLNVATSSYRTNLRYSLNQSQTSYKSNLPKNHKLNFMHSNTTHSMLNQFLERSPNSKPQHLSNSLTKTNHCDLEIPMDNEDIEFPEICNLSPEINNNLECSLDTSQVISLTTTDNRDVLSSESFYNVSDLGDSPRQASKYPRKGELSYQTDMYLKQIFKNEMKKHSTYKSSKTKDNRIRKETEYSPVEETPQNSYEQNQILNFFSNRSTPSSTTVLYSNPSATPPCLTISNQPRKSRSIPTSTVTLTSLKTQKSSRNFSIPSEVMEARSPKSICAKSRTTIPLSTISQSSVQSSITSISSFTAKLSGRRVTFDIDMPRQQTNDNMLQLQGSSHTAYENNYITSTSISSSSTNQSSGLHCFMLDNIPRKNKAEPTSTVTLSALKTQRSSRNLYNNKTDEPSHRNDESVQELSSISLVENSSKNNMELPDMNSARNIYYPEDDTLDEHLALSSNSIGDLPGRVFISSTMNEGELDFGDAPNFSSF